MTWLERYLKENPETVGCDDFIKSIVIDRCPYEFFDDADRECYLDNADYIELDRCEACWNQRIPGKEEIDIEAINVEFEEDVIIPDNFDIMQWVANLYHIPKKVLEEKDELFKNMWDKLVDSIHEGKHKTMENFKYKEQPQETFIRDSGNRREFESGAVRDIQEGKGRCDLLPIDVVGIHMHDPVFTYIDLFQDTGDEKHLYDVIDQVVYSKLFPDHKTLFLEVAKHFEEGCKKYGENNWRMGIPTHCYIDSAVRHYLKHLRGDKDEPHDRAFVWNILCCIWTCQNKPELNDYCKEEK